MPQKAKLQEARVRKDHGIGSLFVEVDRDSERGICRSAIEGDDHRIESAVLVMGQLCLEALHLLRNGISQNNMLCDPKK